MFIDSFEITLQLCFNLQTVYRGRLQNKYFWRKECKPYNCRLEELEHDEISVNNESADSFRISLTFGKTQNPHPPPPIKLPQLADFKRIVMMMFFILTHYTAFVLKHLLPSTVCLSAITEDHYVKSLADKNYVKFSCEGTSSVTVQGNCISNEFKLSSNGMLYVIDFALSAEEGI